MPEDHKKPDLLTSWKEIATYLDCGRRTVIRWEKEFGLPVHRLSDSRRSMVFAYKEEMDEWIASNKKYARKKGNKEKALYKKPIWLRSLFFALPMAAVALLYFLFLAPGLDSEPWDFRIQGSTLIILNKDGTELWHHDTGIENLAGEKSYREHFQYKRITEAEAYLPQLILKDINGDGKNEVLFSTQTQNEYGEGQLFCFSHKGKLRWDFAAGREIKFGDDNYSAEFRIKGFEVSDLDGTGEQKIVVLSNHKPHFPAQLAVLDNKGNTLGEYWNAGYFCDLVAVDLDEDGRKEIILGGCNNEYGNACAVVFDSSDIRGCSPQQSEVYTCKSLERGSEKHYILFPRTEVDRFESPVDAIFRLMVLKNRLLQMTTRDSHIYYELDYDCKVKNVYLSHTFKQNYRLAFLQNKIAEQIDFEEYEEELAKNVLYFDGEEWGNQ